MIFNVAKGPMPKMRFRATHPEIKAIPRGIFRRIRTRIMKKTASIRMLGDRLAIKCIYETLPCKKRMKSYRISDPDSMKERPHLSRINKKYVFDIEVCIARVQCKLGVENIMPKMLDVLCLWLFALTNAVKKSMY